MLAMQYVVKLPSDYEMERIRRRVREKGAAFDGFPGLLQKSFLYNVKRGPDEEGTGWLDQPGCNEYAPFYVWQSTEGMHSFLLGSGFQGLVQSFGRPQVRTWQVLAFDCPGGSHKPDAPAFAVRELFSLADSTPLTQVVEKERALQKQALQHANLYSRVVGVDTERWEIVRYSIWYTPEVDMPADTTNIHAYQLLYLAL